MRDDRLDFAACIDFETRIGEGPVWDAARGVLWFVDILAPAIFAFSPADNSVQRFGMPDLVTSIGLVPDGRLIVSLRRAIHMFDPAAGHLELFVAPDLGDDANRLNDGKVGPDGCFWVGSMHDRRPAQPIGALFRVTPDGTYTTIFNGIRVSNGLAWSPDGRTMYHADSRGPFIKAYSFDPKTGSIGGARILASPDEAEGLPDGAAVDRNGNYWSAGVTAGRLNVYSSQGEILRRIPVPMAAPTMPCFGGEDLKTLFVTGLTREIDGEVVSRGSLLACRVDIAGTTVAKFGEPTSLFDI